MNTTAFWTFRLRQPERYVRMRFSAPGLPILKAGLLLEWHRPPNLIRSPQLHRKRRHCDVYL
jgi:hypothetical protein